MKLTPDQANMARDVWRKRRGYTAIRSWHLHYPGEKQRYPYWRMLKFTADHVARFYIEFHRCFTSVPIEVELISRRYWPIYANRRYYKVYRLGGLRCLLSSWKYGVKQL